MSEKPLAVQKSKSKKDASRTEALRKDIDHVAHTWEEEKLYSYYGITLETGLSSEQVEQQRAKHGYNRLTPPASKPEWLKYAEQFTNFFALLLIAGGILCFISFALNQDDRTNVYLGSVLLLVVLITGTFTYFQEAKSERIMEGFKSMVPKLCQVRRDGKIEKVDAVELVPGDVVLLNEGDQVPSDIRIMKATELKVDNSSLTGESEAQDRVPTLAKDAQGNFITQPLEATNLVFYTTLVSSGNGVGVVIGTGDHTVMGQIAGLATETSGDKTPIRKELEKFITFISAVAITLGIIFLILSIVIYKEVITSIVFAIGIIVANVPEGLLATVTVGLTITAQRMAAKQVLVKNLEAVETLGSTTVIASDKTGTLTQNRMTVQHCWYDGKILRTPAARNKPLFDAVMKQAAGKEQLFNPNDVTFQYLQMVATICNNSSFLAKDADGNKLDMKSRITQPDFNVLQQQCSGDASESGLIKFVNVLRDIEDYRQAMKKLFEIKFNSTNKWQLSIHAPEDSSIDYPILALKGAPERVLKMCKKIIINGEEVELDAAWEARYTQAYESLGGMGERVLGFAFKNMKGFSLDYPFTNKPEPNFPLNDLTFVGLFSMIDPPKEGVPEAVAKCKRARIKVFMVTGDHPITAQAIAKQVGIIDQDVWDAGRAAVVKGDDIREILELPDSQQKDRFDEIFSHEQLVFARVSPAHKLIIVENAQFRGEVVAVTGDGVNDAPALKKGDIGVAMGIAGKDVSKEAADMILLDDNFASIVNGVEEGRLIFDNLKKSIAYTLTSNIPEIGPFIAFIIVKIPLPLSTVLILCVDLGTDMIPAISMAQELKEADIMDRPPRNAKLDRLVNARLISFAYLQIGIFQVLAGFFTWFVVMNDYGYRPEILPNLGRFFDEQAIMCNFNPVTRKVARCGFTCEGTDVARWGKNPDGSNNDVKVPCENGCPIPFPGLHDPFYENTEFGFRGFVPGFFESEELRQAFDDAGVLRADEGKNNPGGKDRWAEVAVCGRTCGWYQAITNIIYPDTEITVADQLLEYSKEYKKDREAYVLKYEAEDDQTKLQARQLYTEEDKTQFEVYCSADMLNGGKPEDYGFTQREIVSRTGATARIADAGDVYWWNGKLQFWGNQQVQFNVLSSAQTAYFVSIVVVQWADLLISKTRKLSVLEQGMKNSFMNFGLFSETALALLLCYVPFLNTIFTTRPIHSLHWFPGIGWSMMIFTYDETRKYLMRAGGPVGDWLYRWTYW